MPQLTRCPQCDKGLKIPDSKAGALVKCPKCGEKFRAPSGESAPNPRRQRSAGRSRSRDNSEYDEEDSNPYQSPPSRRKGSAKRAEKFEVAAFVRKVALVVGGICALSVLFAVGGLFAEVSAIIATVILVVACLGCVLVGRFWIAFDLLKENVGQGLAALFIPAVGLALAMMKKGRLLRGAIVYGGAIPPLLLLGLMLLVFNPMYNSRGGAGGGTPSKAMNPDSWADIIRTRESTVPADAATSTINARITAVRGDTSQDVASKGEGLLSQFALYEAGSLQVDTQTNTLTFRIKGPSQNGSPYCHFLALSTGTMIMVTP